MNNVILLCGPSYLILGWAFYPSSASQSLQEMMGWNGEKELMLLWAAWRVEPKASADSARDLRYLVSEAKEASLHRGGRGRDGATRTTFGI